MDKKYLIYYTPGQKEELLYPYIHDQYNNDYIKILFFSQP